MRCLIIYQRNKNLKETDLINQNKSSGVHTNWWCSKVNGFRPGIITLRVITSIFVSNPRILDHRIPYFMSYIFSNTQYIFLDILRYSFKSFIPNVNNERKLIYIYIFCNINLISIIRNSYKFLSRSHVVFNKIF